MRIRSLLSLHLLALTLCVYTQNSFSSEPVQKKWELGLGVGSLIGPDYLGSDEYRSYTSLIPYVIYRGRFIRSDRDGLRGQFFRSDKFEFTLSASAAITPDTDKNELRQGMPSLGSTLEFGPSFNINLSGESFSQGWYLQLPWRAVFAIDADDSGYLGSIFQPQLVYRNKLNDWDLTYRAGLSIASNDYQDYYYSVAPEYETLERETFNASGGYTGWNNQIAVSRGFNYQGIRTRVALLVRYDNLSGADISASPLVATTNGYRAGVALIWLIK